MPFLAPQNDHPVFLRIVFFLQYRVGLLQNRVFRILPLFVLPTEGRRNFGCTRQAVCQEQFRREQRTAHASRGIDARRQSKTDHARRHPFVFYPGFPHQHPQAGIVRVDKILQTVCHNRTVFPVQRHDVGNRSHGNQIQIIVQHLCEMIRSGKRAD